MLTSEHRLRSLLGSRLSIANCISLSTRTRDRSTHTAVMLRNGLQVLLKRLLAVRFQQEQDKLNQRPMTHNPTYALLACIAITTKADMQVGSTTK